MKYKHLFEATTENWSAILKSIALELMLSYCADVVVAPVQ